MTYIIVGGSAGLGRAIAKKFASEKNDLIIISSDLRDTKALASDLEIRYGVIPNIIKGPSKRIVQNCFPEYHKFIDELKKFDPRRIYKSDVSEKLGL